MHTGRTKPSMKLRLRHFFEQTAVELFIGLIIVISVILTMIEISLHESSHYVPVLDAVNWTITLFFTLELTLRCMCAPSRRRFFREYWVDILALLPLLRVFRTFRALRLLRLLRILRLVGFFARSLNRFHFILRRGALEFLIICSILVVTVIFASGAMLAFERHHNPEMKSFGHAFWFSVYSLLAGEPIPGPPSSVGGRVITVIVMFIGLTVFAMLTGTVSAFMIEGVFKEGRVVKWEEISNHSILCGWNRKAKIMLRQYIAAAGKREAPIVVIADLEEEPELSEARLRARVRFLDGDFTRVSVLEKAGIHRAERG